VDEETGEVTGRADHQAPETDGQVVLRAADDGWEPRPGTFVTAKVTGTEGVDLIAVVVSVESEVPRRLLPARRAVARRPWVPRR